MARGAEAKVKVRITDGGDLKKIEKGSRQADRALKGTAKTSSSSTKNFSKMSQGITGGLVPAYATLAANLFAITAVFGALKEAADLRVMREGMIAYGISTGTAMQTVSRSLQQVTDGMLDYGEAMKATATLTAAGFSSSMIMEMGEAAKNASAALGHNFEDAFNRITKGIQKAEPELLDELGIVLRLDEATRKYAQQVGKMQKDLTLYERTVAVHNEVIGQATEKYGKLDSELKVSGINQMAAVFENVKKAGLEGIAPLAEFFASVFSKNIGLVIAAMGLFAVSMLKAAGIGDSLKAKTELWTVNATEGATNARAAVATYNEELRRANMDMDELKAGAQGGLMKLNIPKKGRFQGRKLMEEGRFDELAKNKKILRSWKATAKEHLIITKNMTDAEYMEFEQMVDDLLLEEETFVKQSKSILGKWAVQTKEIFANVNIGIQGFKGGVVKMFSGLGKAMGKMMSVIGWASILTMLFKTLKEGWMNLDKTVNTFISWGEATQKWLDSKGLDTIAGWVKTLTDKTREGTEAWRKYKKEAREINEISENISSASENLNDSLGEFNMIQREITDDMGNMVNTSERFIKSMKLMESLTVGSTIATWTAELGGLNETMVAQQKILDELLENPVEAILGDTVMKATGFWEQMAAGIMAGQGIAPGAGGPQAFTYEQEVTNQGEVDAYDQAVANASQLIADAIAGINSDDIISGLETQEAMKQGFMKLNLGVTDEVAEGFDPAAAIQAIQNAGDDPAAIADVLAKLGIGFKAFEAAVIKPGKAMLELKEVSASYIKEMAKMKEKNYPAGFAKLGTFVNLAANNLAVMNTEQNKNTLISTQEAEALKAIGIQWEGNLTVAEAYTLVIKEQQRLHEVAWGFEKEKLRIQNEAIERQNVGTKLGGALGKELKSKEKIAKLEDSISINLQDQAALRASEDQYTKEAFKQKMDGLKKVESQLIKNRDIEKESMKLQFKLVNSFQMAFENLFTEIAKGEKRIGEIFKDVTRMMLQQMAQIMAQAASIAAMKAMFGPSLFGVPIGGREGGVFSPPGYRSFAGGGIATGSNSGYLATLHGTEAVVPLGNDKSIPVKLSGDSISTSNITVNVSTQGGQQTTSAGAGQSERKLGQMIAAAVQGEILDQQRPGGILSPYGDGGP